MTKTRFLIASRGRVGSNLLLTLLDSHPACRVRSELLSEAYPLSERLTKKRALHPVDYFEKEAWGGSFGKKAVGGKVFYQHLEAYPSVLEALVIDTSVKVLHLTRENILRTHLSKRMAEVTGQWIKGDAGAQEPITLSVAELQDAFAWTTAGQARLRKLFANHPMMEISYEHLVDKTKHVLAEAQAFLGLPLQLLNSPLEKQLDKSLPELVTNYVELKAHFSGTPWARFFGE